ncbi:hypothetical protein Q31b_24520 [Novipirellula aureliae]|uniref:Uncharacterized protein n=1 Tax=Novipirellula aureliae TaxID=2527966 RepID=A0A5C6E189_9BACT|nr:hypothetical protein Q31b_24520 [Novipirellula aureliae]
MPIGTMADCTRDRPVTSKPKTLAITPANWWGTGTPRFSSNGPQKLSQPVRQQLSQGNELGRIPTKWHRLLACDGPTAGFQPVIAQPSGTGF